MTNPTPIRLMPTKMKYKLVISFCLMSLLPILVGVYIASLFIQFPFAAYAHSLWIVSVVTVLSVTLSFLGYVVTRQMVVPIVDVSRAAQEIAEGKLTQTPDFRGADEIEDLSHSLKTISENARELLRKVDKLTLKDKLTGLYNVSYIRERLNEEIQRAIHYQRPCSFAYLTVDNFESYGAAYGQAAGEAVLKAVAGVFNETLSEFDRAARVTNGEFAIIFFDRNKKNALGVVAEIHRKVSGLASVNLRPGELAVSVGLSENPLDGVTAAELYTKAQARMKAARLKGRNRVEAFA